MCLHPHLNRLYTYILPEENCLGLHRRSGEIKLSYNPNGVDELKSQGKWIGTYHITDELLICLHHWFDLFRSLDPLAKPFFRLRRRFQRFPFAKFSNIRLLILHIPANIFLCSSKFMSLKSLGSTTLNV